METYRPNNLNVYVKFDIESDLLVKNTPPVAVIRNRGDKNSSIQKRRKNYLKKYIENIRKLQNKTYKENSSISSHYIFSYYRGRGVLDYCV